MLLRLVIGIIVVYLLYKLLRKGVPTIIARQSEAPLKRSGGEDLVEDPFCHTYLPVSHALRVSHDGKILYFCSQECLDQYQVIAGKKG